MKRAAPIPFFAALLVAGLDSAHAIVTYPAGTTVPEAFMAPPRVAADRAVRLLTDDLLTPATEESRDINDRTVEALKYLLANRNDAATEPSDEPGTLLYGGEISLETATPEQRGFLEAFSITVLERLGALAALQPSTAPSAVSSGSGVGSTAAADLICVREAPVLLQVKYKLKFHFARVDVYGLAVFGVNLRYGVNNSDVVYGLFPFGYAIGYFDGLACVLKHGIPDSQEDLRACGREKHWMVQGASRLDFTMLLNHEVPSVAAASLPYLGSVLTNQAAQFRIHNQLPIQDSSSLLGLANTPLPSHTGGFTYKAVPGIRYSYDFSMVVSGYPTLILFAGVNNLVRAGGATFVYSGNGEGNPHSIGDFKLHRDVSLFHDPLPPCH